MTVVVLIGACGKAAESATVRAVSVNVRCEVRRMISPSSWLRKIVVNQTWTTREPKLDDMTAPGWLSGASLFERVVSMESNWESSSRSKCRGRRWRHGGWYQKKRYLIKHCDERIFCALMSHVSLKLCLHQKISAPFVHVSYKPLARVQSTWECSKSVMEGG